MQRPELTGEIQEASKTQRPYTFACTFYGITTIDDVPLPQGSFTIPFGSAFENLASLSVNFAQVLSNDSKNLPFLREIFSGSLMLMDKLVGRLGTEISVAWKPEEWLSVVLDCLEHDVRPFALSSKFPNWLTVLICRQRTSPSSTV